MRRCRHDVSGGIRPTRTVAAAACVVLSALQACHTGDSCRHDHIASSRAAVSETARAELPVYVLGLDPGQCISCSAALSHWVTLSRSSETSLSIVLTRESSPHELLAIRAARVPISAAPELIVCEADLSHGVLLRRTASGRYERTARNVLASESATRALIDSMFVAPTKNTRD